MKPEDRVQAPPLRVTLRDGRPIAIRLLQVSDGEAMADFYAAIPDKDGRYYIGPSGRTREKALARAAMADSPYEVCLVLADDAGMLHGEAWFRWSAERTDQSTFGIAIRRTMQGVGAGRLIMTRLMEIGDAYGPPVMNLTAQEENERAWKLYTSMGFVILRRQIRPAREDAPPLPEFYMERDMGKTPRLTTPRRIVNIVNFIRAVEPRDARLDLVEPVNRQIELITRHGLPATWLLQYDALVQGPYLGLMKRLGPEHEIGGWFEVVQPLVEKAGLIWRGRYPWDWHAHVGFSIGYTPAEREKLADAFMAGFKAAFGRYPASVGSWFMDAHLLGYLHDRYGLVASCNCKDQWGTDGYTLWGGYWNQAFYPSRRNAFMPAQTAAAQIPVPVFRMLGSDPIYQYDAGLFDGANCTEVKAQGVVSLEPVYKDGGGNPAWVRWFFDSMAQAPCLAFAYAQVGQENSFGWPGMAKGLTDQVELLADLQTRGVARVQTLESSARWFRQKFAVTPAAAVTALNDHRNEERKSVWYQSRFHRVNLYWHGDRCRVRDIHLFSERYTERYLTATCPGTACTYDTLPLAEGFLWSDQTVVSGLVPLRVTTKGATAPMRGGAPMVTDDGAATLVVRWPVTGRKTLVITCAEDSIAWELAGNRWCLELRWKEGVDAPFQTVSGNRLLCRHNGFDYAVTCRTGRIELDIPNRRLLLVPSGGRVVLGLAEA
jgi:ribosomal protein S18 acetylase RimI-like enzyme